ncbi:MAG: reverse transcriptase family protein [Nitrososphaeraceae archaeon]|nr:reverse transcriptase family protein [Nitrososphaeraceae archaeon]
MPRIDEILESLNGSKWFFTFDLASGFWQIEMDQKDREKTAFVIKGGHYEFNVMPFRLCNAPATFQKTMNKVLKEYIDRFVAVFIDDIIVYSNSFEEHCGHLQMLFDKLETANLALNKEKCEMFKRELRFLGHKINKHGIQPDPQKIEKVQNFPIPKNVRQIKGFLGLASYYRKFIKDFSKIAKLLNNLTKKGVDYN